MWTYNAFWNYNEAPAGPGHDRALSVSFGGEIRRYATVILGPGFLTDPGYGRDIPSGQNITLIHQGLHILKDKNDVDLAKQLKLDEQGYDISDPTKAAQAISTWLSKNCKGATE